MNKKNIDNWKCSCHFTMQEHFQDLARDAGKHVARDVYYRTIKNCLDIQKDELRAKFDKWMEEVCDY